MSTFVRWLSMIPNRWPVLGLGFLFVLAVTVARILDSPPLGQYANGQSVLDHPPAGPLMGSAEDRLMALPSGESAPFDARGNRRDQALPPMAASEEDEGKIADIGDGGAVAQAVEPKAEPNNGIVATPPPKASASSKAPSPAAIREAQRLLNDLGYDAGRADGKLGEKTRRAVIAFRGRSGQKGSDTIDGALLADLKTAKTRLDEQRARVAAANATGDDPVPIDKHQTGTVAAVLTGFQRALGKVHDSVHDPKAFYAYCKAVPDTWIFDEGTQQMVFCGNYVPASDRRPTDAASAAGDR